MMKFKFLKIIGIGFILSVSTLANATLIDNGDYSTDTESGLDWLDWTETIDMSQAEALDEFGGAGWRIATASEARGLLEREFNIDNLLPLTEVGDIAGHAIKLNDFSALFGHTQATVEGSGLYGADSWFIYVGYLNEAFGVTGSSDPLFGVALAKATAVSEPAIITLFTLGLVGIGIARRRQS
jgi:hypothetical protein